MNNKVSEAKFGVQILAYNQEEYIQYCLLSIYKEVDFIQIMYSSKPWTMYNSNARNTFMTSDKTVEIIKAFPDYKNSIHVCSGEWESQEEMRYEAYKKIENLGADYCLLIDADEIWDQDQLRALKSFTLENINGNKVGRVHFKQPFKWMNRLIDDPNAHQSVVFACNQSIEFKDLRTPTGEKVMLPKNIFFWHLGYILSDNRMYEKINTYGHHKELPLNWYEHKWKAFNSSSINLCRKDPKRWPKTIEFDPWDLPTILYTHPYFPYGPQPHDSFTKISDRDLIKLLTSENNIKYLANVSINIYSFYLKINDKSSHRHIKNSIGKNLIIYLLIQRFALRSFVSTEYSTIDILCALETFNEQNLPNELIHLKNYISLHKKVNDGCIYTQKMLTELKDFNSFDFDSYISSDKTYDLLFISDIANAKFIEFADHYINLTNSFLILKYNNSDDLIELLTFLNNRIIDTNTKAKWYIVFFDNIFEISSIESHFTNYHEGDGIIIYDLEESIKETDIINWREDI